MDILQFFHVQSYSLTKTSRIITELRRHGYDLSPGTLYPILHRMEGKGYLKSKIKTVKGKIRRIYSITPLGNNTLSDAKNKVKELFGELFEHDEK